MTEATEKDRHEEILKLGYVLQEENKGHNEYRHWTTRLYSKGTNQLLYNNSDCVIILRDSKRRILLETRTHINFDALYKF